MSIIIEGGITVGPGITISDYIVNTNTDFITEITLETFITEDSNILIEE